MNYENVNRPFGRVLCNICIELKQSGSINKNIVSKSANFWKGIFKKIYRILNTNISELCIIIVSVFIANQQFLGTNTTSKINKKPSEIYSWRLLEQISKFLDEIFERDCVYTGKSTKSSEITGCWKKSAYFLRHFREKL